MANEASARQRTPDEVQREISATRAELDQTLDEIGRRLSPQEIKERVMDSAKETVAEVRDSVEQNKTPLLLAGGAAVAALLLHHHWRARQMETRADYIRDIWDRVSAGLAHTSRTQLESRLSDVAGTVSDVAYAARDTMNQAMSDVLPKVAHTAREARALMDDVPPASLWTFGLSLASALLVNALSRRPAH